MKKTIWKQRLCQVFILFFTVVSALSVRSMDTQAAGASQPKEVLLGMFFNSEEDQSDTLYVSFDGLEFRKIGYAFEDRDKTSSAENRIICEVDYAWCLHDPSIQYHDGFFWAMSGYTPTQGDRNYFEPMLASSPDLIHWSYPNSNHGLITPTVWPMGKDGEWNNRYFDVAAPELLIEENGDAWIVACLGYYGAFNDGDFNDDHMSPYLIKLTGLAPGSKMPIGEYERAEQPEVAYSDAMPIRLPVDAKDRIDGMLYKENGVYYLAIKENGITNELWSITDLNNCGDPNAWTLVNPDVVTGYEGPCITHFGNKYYMYTDKLASFPFGHADGTTGTFMTSAERMEQTWAENRRIRTIDVNGTELPNRHGSVITVSDPDAVAVVMNAYEQAGWKEIPAHWEWNDGKAYWYENGVRQGTMEDVKGVMGENPETHESTNRGREIYDSVSDGWYWLDSIYDGAKAVGKEVWMPYIYQNEAEWNDEEKRKIAYESDSGMGECVLNAINNHSGKWVRYDENGAMLKGWVTIEGALAELYPKQKGNTYYYDHRTGLMAKGNVSIEGVQYHFDEVTGVQKK